MFNIGAIFRNLPGVTKNLVIINVIVFVLTAVYNARLGPSDESLQWILGIHYPGSPAFEPYQIITHMFMHGGFLHLLFNMLMLVFMGAPLEREWGAKKFLAFYFASGLGATVLSTFTAGLNYFLVTGTWILVDEGAALNPDFHLAWQSAYGWHAVGASGAVYGLILAYAVYYPNREIYLYMLFPVKMKYFAAGLIALAVFGGVARMQGDNVAHFAHLGGAIIGYFIARYWKRNRYRYR